MASLSDGNTQRADSMVKTWPQWKRDYQLTKYKSGDHVCASQTNTDDAGSQRKIPTSRDRSSR
jgi:hypothetical protein